MKESLQTILQIQELDIKMIRLMRVKNERKEELLNIQNLRADIQNQVEEKEKQVTTFKKEIRHGETQVKEIQEKTARLESQAAAVKKMDEFNALTQEMTTAAREKNSIEHNLSDLMDKLASEEDLLVALRDNLHATEESSIALEKEINESIVKINEEGQELLKERGKLTTDVDPEVFQVYEKLLKNKKDRVVVSIENRVCSGCHIVLTAQHENLVRKGDRLVFCEHCSRMLFWQAPEVVEEGGEVRRRRRRRTTAQ